MPARDVESGRLAMLAGLRHVLFVVDQVPREGKERERGEEGRWRQLGGSSGVGRCDMKTERAKKVDWEEEGKD